MPNPIVFPCPHCGASISVDGSATSTQCQFCGSSAAVPDELRPKVAPPDPAAPAMSISDLYSGMPGMSGMSQNFDVGKLKAMADAVRAGNKIEAIRLYRENFGVDLAAARQAVDLMTSGRSVGFGQMQTGTPVTFDVSGMAASTPPAMPQPLPYVMPSPPMIMTPQVKGRGGATCFVLGLFLLIGVITAGGIIAGIVAGTPGLSTSFTNLFNQASNTYPRVVLTFGGKGSGVGLFTDPRTISVDAKGNIYVADYSDGRVQVFDSQGNYASQWKITDEKKPP